MALGDYPVGADARPHERDGRSAIERYAVARLAQDVAAMPASEVVQLVLWPQTLADWVREVKVAPAVAYNMLHRFKPYRRVRELLAHRLGLPAHIVDHLVDAQRPLVAAQRASPATAAGTELPPPLAPATPSPTLQLPAERDGSNPIEQRAVWRVWHDVAQLPASMLVQIAMFPESLADWARRRGVPPSMVYSMLAGSQAHAGLREALARRLDLPRRAVDRLLDAPRAEPLAPHPPPLADRAAPIAQEADSAADALPDAPASGDQFSLGI